MIAGVTHRHSRHTDWVLPAGAALLALYVHRLAILSFFSADDLVHLQQAVGLLPTPHQPWRFLTQVAYFRGMVATFGPRPFFFFAVNLGLHVVNVVLLFRLVVSRGIPNVVAGLASVLFGACPLLFIVIAHAVAINDITALFFMLLALDWLWRSSPKGTVIGAILVIVALLCKESVLFLSLLVLLPGLAQQSVRVRFKHHWPLLAIVMLTGLMFFVARSRGLAPAGSAYALSPIAPFHNLMTYTAWWSRLDQPLPDLVRSFDPHAWHIGLPLLLLLLAARVVCSSSLSIDLGLAWWILGLLPVLPLRNSAYPHYLYVALPGLALATAGAIHGALTALWSRTGGRPLRGSTRGITVVLVTLAIAYGVRADWLIGRRLELHVEGSYLPLDPQIRTIVAAGQAVESIARHPPAPHSRLLILTPREEVRVFGARSGKEYALDGRVSDAYDLQRAVLSGGRALRVFFPQIDSVRFAPHWSPEWAGWVIAKRGDAGTLELFDDTPSGRSDLIRSYEKEGALHFAEELRTLMDVPSRPPKPSQ